MKQLIKKLFRKEPGNSLTFLLTSITVIGLSVAATTVSLGPLSAKKEQMNTSYSLSDVADHHLAKIRSYILAHPAMFSQSSNFFPSDQAKDYTNDGLPPFQVFQSSASTFNTFMNSSADLKALATYTETVRINGSQLTATSVIPYNADPENADQGRFGIVKFAKTPYRNTLRVVVKVTAGDKTLIQSKLIGLSPELCDASTTQPTGTNTNILSAGDNGNFAITGMSDAALELGDQKICWLPERGRALSCDAGLAWRYGVDLISSSSDRLSDGQMRYVVYLTHKMYSGGTSDPTFIQLKGMYLPDSGNATILDKGGITLTIPATANDVFATHTLKPDANDANGTYKTFIFWRNSSNNKFYYTYVKFNKTQIFSEGLYKPGTTNGDWQQLQTATGGLATPWDGVIGRFSYDPKLRMLTASGNIAGGPRLFSSTITKFEPNVQVTNTNCGSSPGNTVGCSDYPTQYNPARYLFNQSSFVYDTPVVSSDGQFAVMPVLATHPSAGSRVVMMAWNMDLARRIDNGNSTTSTGYPSLPVGMESYFNSAGRGNFAALADYMSYGTGLTYISDGQNVTSLSNVKLWYQNGKFYWLLKGSSSVYEWDPATWGKSRNLTVNGSTVTLSTFQSGTSLTEQLRNFISLGEDSTNNYTGVFQTVRKIGPESGTGSNLWSTTPPPQIVVNSGDREFYVRDGAAVHRVDLKRGYTYNVFGTALQTAINGNSLAFDPNSRTLYYSTRGSGSNLYSYNPKTGKSTALLNSPLTPPNFNDASRAGDGNIFYSPLTQSLYYLDVSSNTAAVPQFFRYMPTCFALGAGDGTASTLLKTSSQ